MSDDMKRVGLIFNADGSADFTKSLQTINAELRENYQNFKLTQSKWDEGTKTSEKLNARLVSLNESYEIQSKKVRQLEINLKELENAEVKDEKAIQQKKAALAQAKAELQRYENQIKDTSEKIKRGTADLEDFAKKLDKTGGNLVDAGKKMSVFSAAYVAALGLATKNAIDFESSFAGVLKTVDGTPEQLDAIKKGIRDMAKEIPSGTSEINAVAEAAGQLGIETENVLSFTRTMIDMGQATNLSAEEGATTLARFANVTKMSQSDFNRLGSSIVALGNNFATTEAEIASMAMNLGSAGTQVGMSQADILALSTALSSVGLEAQAGGTAFSKAMIEMQVAVETGNDKLQDFASVAGMTTDEFSKRFKEDATGALMSFIDGLSKTGEQGESAIKVLDDMGIKETRLRDALLRSANASEIFTDTIDLSSQAWEENIALTDEAAIRYQTTESQLAITKNMISDIALSFGELVLPLLNKFIEKVQDVLQKLGNLDPRMQSIILIIGGVIAAIGPLLIFLGKIATGISSLIGLGIKMIPMFKAIGTAISAIVTFITGLSLATVALVAAVGAAVFLIIKYWDEISEFTKKLVENIKEYFSAGLVYVKEIFTNLFSGLKEGFLQFVENIKEVIATIKESFFNTLESIKTFFSESFLFIKDVVTNFISDLIEKIVSLGERLLEILAGPINFVENLALLIVALVAILIENIVNLVKPFIENIVNMITTFADNVKNIIDKSLKFITEQIDKFKEWLSNLISTILEFITTTANKIKEVWSNVMEFLKNNVFEPIRSFAVKSFEKIRDAVISVANKVKEIWNQVGSFLKNNVFEPLKNTVSTIFSTIGNTASNIANKVKNAFLTAINAVKSAFEGLKTVVSRIFETIGNLIKTPINGIIRGVNAVIDSLNKIKVPSWVPGIGGKGINFNKINFLQMGGELLGGQSLTSATIVGEDGPEIMYQGDGRTSVVPLTASGGSNKTEIIDYNKMADALVGAMLKMKFTLDDDGFGRFIKDYLLEVIPDAI